MKYSKLLTTLTTVGLMAAASSASAMGVNHADVDLNKDGIVTEAEIINVIKGHFLQMDSDHSSSVSESEWNAYEDTES